MDNKQWTLVWEDDFNGDSIDTNNWGYEIGKIRNNELQYYTNSSKNSYVKDSCLIIEGIRESYKGSDYTSASLNTLGKRDFLYGKIEMRARLPYGAGIWPAFWTLGTDIGKCGWPKCGEIDIMELIGGNSRNDTSDSRIHANIHYPDKKPPAPNNTYSLKDVKFADDFHIIGCIWEEKSISWYVDDDEYYSVDISEISEFHKPQYILVNLAIGGNWPGSPDESTVFPQKYYIDWIRYYK